MKKLAERYDKKFNFEETVGCKSCKIIINHDLINIQLAHYQLSVIRTVSLYVECFLLIVDVNLNNHLA